MALPWVLLCIEPAASGRVIDLDAESRIDPRIRREVREGMVAVASTASLKAVVQP